MENIVSLCGRVLTSMLPSPEKMTMVHEGIELHSRDFLSPSRAWSKDEVGLDDTLALKKLK